MPRLFDGSSPAPSLPDSGLGPGPGAAVMRRSDVLAPLYALGCCSLLPRLVSKFGGGNERLAELGCRCMLELCILADDVSESDDVSGRSAFYADILHSTVQNRQGGLAHALHSLKLGQGGAAAAVCTALQTALSLLATDPYLNPNLSATSDEEGSGQVALRLMQTALVTAHFLCASSVNLAYLRQAGLPNLLVRCLSQQFAEATVHDLTCQLVARLCEDDGCRAALCSQWEQQEQQEQVRATDATLPQALLRSAAQWAHLPSSAALTCLAVSSLCVAPRDDMLACISYRTAEYREYSFVTSVDGHTAVQKEDKSGLSKESEEEEGGRSTDASSSVWSDTGQVSDKESIPIPATPTPTPTPTAPSSSSASASSSASSLLGLLRWSRPAAHPNLRGKGSRRAAPSSAHSSSSSSSSLAAFFGEQSPDAAPPGSGSGLGSQLGSGSGYALDTLYSAASSIISRGTVG